MFVDVWNPLFWLYVLITAIVPGLIATWLGVGGCFLRIPLLMYLFGVPIKCAYCINQATVALATLPGVIEHWRQKHVYARGFVVAAVSSTAGTMVGAYLVAKYIPAQHLKIIFGVACIGAGIYIAWKTVKARTKLVKRVTVEHVTKLEAGFKLAALMFAAGLATGVCGFGGGIYYVPIYIGLAYPTHVAVGTSSAQMIASASAGAAVLTAYGYMIPTLFIAVAIPTLIASYIGAKLAAKSPPWILRLVYAAAIVAAGAYVTITTLQKLL